MLPVALGPKVITLSGFHCTYESMNAKNEAYDSTAQFFLSILKIT
jgi:hypothetical protein